MFLGVAFGWKDVISKGPFISRRTCAVGVFIGFFLCCCFYINNEVWLMPRFLMTTSYSDNKRTIKQHWPYFRLPGQATNTALTLHHHDTRHPVNPDQEMLVNEYNPSPQTQHRLSFKGCDYRCALTNDSSLADLLYINAGQIFPELRLPSTRRKSQIWLLYSRESPSFPRFANLDRPDLRNQINWTRAIFSDATFPLVYGHLRQSNPPEKDFETIYTSKVYSVAWFVGHCESRSRREEYVRRMTSRIDVHIYGACGNMTCGVRGYKMGGHMDECLGMVARKYMFYLSFENALCENYVSEKFFNLFRSSTSADIIPVVRGGADYKQLFDPEIFVDAADFRSPEELAEYLSDLAADKERYLAMIKRKSRYTLTKAPEMFECTLCRALHNKDIPNQSYADIYSFWKHPNRCCDPQDLG